MSGCKRCVGPVCTCSREYDKAVPADERRVLHEWTEQPPEEFRAAGSVTFQLLDATVPWSRFEIRSLRGDVASGNYNSTALIASLLVRAERAESEAAALRRHHAERRADR